ncbi:MAG: succinate dehydrogenase/fumarate reductase cytochrome b subunit [Candidatus Symbiothrix sp.]|jgi:succinate dehydrogenase / fumarate reductase cytochrome b subunit|nr:succinate dehydrogenase/fumarate reductase cytochrome b subunit [Candidatus Symbiothrix sp.]
MDWLLNSSIGRKFIMGISGIFLVLFLLFHMSMNLVLVFSTEGYDMICEFLGANWYALVATLGLAAGVVIHICYASLLTLQNRKARGANKYVSSNKTKTEWSAKNMYVLGLVVVLGLLLHLWNFWYNMQFAELIQSPDAVHEGSALVINLFSSPCYAIVYLIWLAAIWLHLTHGIWSAFQTLGLNGKTWFPRWKVISNVVATIIIIGFAVVPIYFTCKALFCGGACCGI